AFDFESLPRLNWYLPGHLSIAAWIAAGVEPLRERLARRLGGAGAAAALACALVAAPPAAYALIVFTPAGNPLRAAMGGAHARADTHYHDRILYYLWPPKNRYDEATEYLRRALDAIPEGAYVVADLQERDALAYTLVLGLAPRPFEVHHFSPQGEQSLRLFREALAREVGARSVLVDAAYVPLARDQGFDARQRDILWEIVPTPTGDGR
ncbi:MAG: hypothetical protein HY608_07785, partial [Planctomycetes bacterium]|nr:hypothetical protein [Planctomycetota bacterium]